MILIGQQERVVIVGPTVAHHCLRCHTETEFAPQLRYRMARIDLLFGLTYQRRYELACSRCGHGWVLDTDTMDQQLGGVPIPWRHRFGLPLMLVVVAGLAALAVAARIHRPLMKIKLLLMSHFGTRMYE